MAASDLVLAMTGASGAIYGVRLLEVLIRAGRTVHLVMSPAAVQVLAGEMDRQVRLDHFQLADLLGASASKGSPPLEGYREKHCPPPPESPSPGEKDQGKGSPPLSLAERARGQVIYHDYRDFTAGIASGSFLTGGMVICPCSMGTVGAIAHGLSQNLIHRAADVHLKERRRLVLVPRETPLHLVQLRNLAICAEAGAVILPAMPAFYTKPTTLDDMVSFIVGRICDQLGVDNQLVTRWGQESGAGFQPA